MKTKIFLLKYICKSLIIFIGTLVTPFYYIAIGLRKLYELIDIKLASYKKTEVQNMKDIKSP